MIHRTHRSGQAVLILVLLGGCNLGNPIESGKYLCTTDQECQWGWRCLEQGGGQKRCVNPASPQETKVTSSVVLAGATTSGYLDGRPAEARFAYPQGIAVDRHLDVFIADSENHRIRKLSSCAVGTLAGSGPADTGGFADGSLAASRLAVPVGIAMDAGGRIYVADSGNHRIRVIDGGTISTLAGSGNEGFKDGAAGEALFDSPSDVAVDRNGKVYVADTNNHRIRVIAGGKVTTLAGSGAKGFADGLAAQAKFQEPTGIDVDGQGRVYVADYLNARVRIIHGGKVETLAGAGEAGPLDKHLVDGPADKARFHGPRDVAVDSGGRVFVADTYNGRIRLISGGQVYTLQSIHDTVRYLALDRFGRLYLSEGNLVRRLTIGALAAGAVCELDNCMNLTPPPYVMLKPGIAHECRSSICLFANSPTASGPSPLPLCTRTCQSAGDCPEATEACPGGFFCVAAIETGRARCCKMCICRDFAAGWKSPTTCDAINPECPQNP